MPFESEQPDTTAASSLSPKKRNGAANQGATLGKAMQNVVKKNAIGGKPNAAPKKTCICAPTTHVGSFRCHLHRMAAPPHKSSRNLEDSHSKGRNRSFNSTSTNPQQQHNHHLLSRFGRATSTECQHLSDLKKEEHSIEVLRSSSPVVASNMVILDRLH